MGMFPPARLLDPDSLDLIEGDFIGCAVVELGLAAASLVGSPRPGMLLLPRDEETRSRGARQGNEVIIAGVFGESDCHFGLNGA
jgi:hypothetical protein